jgi:hypothetical protein
MSDPERRFLFSLADQFGMPVSVLEAVLPREELLEWAAFRRVQARLKG